MVHCGCSTRGEYINTLSAVEISSGWWEGDAMMGRSQRGTFEALKRTRERMPSRIQHIPEEGHGGDLHLQWAQGAKQGAEGHCPLAPVLCVHFVRVVAEGMVGGGATVSMHLRLPDLQVLDGLGSPSLSLGGRLSSGCVLT